MRILLLLLSVLSTNIVIAQSNDESAVNDVLDSYHKAAAAADWDIYFNLMSEDAVFLGTDAGERWPKEVFREYAANRNGWLYTSQQRNINFTPDGNTAWFDEILKSASYGTSRGTGVLIRTLDGWKISQYHLTFPIPNGLARDITDQIKEFEAN